MINPIQEKRFTRSTSNNVTVEAWRRREQLFARILRLYFTKRELVVLYQLEDPARDLGLVA